MPEIEIKEEKLSGGVLVIGSLIWEKSEVRNAWRRESLDLKQHQLISLPIRYGRISSTRNCTYTMVFSSECTVQENLGTGVFIPFSINPIEFKQLEIQAKRMINAEFNKVKNLEFLDWDWGAMGISINPLAVAKDSLKSPLVDLFLKNWSKKYSKSFNPDDYKVGEEKQIISEQGILLIDWPNLPENIDFVIATVIKPQLKNYPSAKNIADRMLVNEYDEYFKENRKEGISTFQDSEIKQLLNKGLT
ncbi:MAG: hypothetical protein KF825_06405 [Ferruginibacter sp.]|nr:hypothetical protein [Ferruginibacter sp.]